MIRLQYQIRRPRPRVKLTRREVFARDRHTCQYCGRQAHDLTLDHVVPRHRGGGHTWENLVTACKSCNHRKGGKTLEEARFRLTPAAVRAAQRRLLAVHAVPRRRAQRGLADVPVPGPELTAMPPAGRDAAAIAATRVPPRRRPASRARHDPLGGRPRGVRRRRLAARRRRSAGRRRDWDLATSALPEQTSGALRRRGLREPLRDGRGPPRRRRPPRSRRSARDHDYADFRRPHRVEFGDIDRGRPRPPRLHGQRDGLGRRRPTRRRGRRRRPGRPVRRRPPTSRPADPARRRRSAPAGSRRTPSGCVRAVRFAATLGFDDRAGDAGRDPGDGAARRAPVRRADRGGARQAARRRAAVGRAAAARRHRRARRDLAGARGPARHRPEQDPGRGPLGSHAPDRRCGARDRPADDPFVGRRCSTTSASPRPPPTATSIGHDAVGAELAGALLDRLHLADGDPRARRPPRPPPHVPLRADWGDPAVRRFIAKIGPDAIDDLFALREADNVGSGVAPRRRRPGRPPRARRGRARRRPDPRPVGARDRRRRPDARARPGRGPGPRADPRRAVRAGRREPGAQRARPAVGLARDWLVRHAPAEDRHAEARPTEVAAPATVRPSRSATPPFADPHAGPGTRCPLSPISPTSPSSSTRSAPRSPRTSTPTLGRLAGIGFRRVEPFDLLDLPATASRAASPATACPRRPPTSGLLGDADLDEVLDAAAELGIGTADPAVDRPGAMADRRRRSAGSPTS